MILLNTTTGRAALSTLARKGPDFQPPLTNAFVTMVERPVLVACEGIAPENAEPVARGLRAFLESEAVPVVFCLSRAGAIHMRCLSPGLPIADEPIAARAVAYVLVRCAWLEDEQIAIELNGRPYRFRLRFDRASGREYLWYPVVEPVPSS